MISFSYFRDYFVLFQLIKSAGDNAFLAKQKYFDQDGFETPFVLIFNRYERILKMGT